MTRYFKPHRQVRPNGVLERVIMDFAPELLDHPSSLSAIQRFVFAPAHQALSATDLMKKLYNRHGAFIDPELVEAFMTCLAGARNFVSNACIEDLQELEYAMVLRNQQMAEWIDFLLDNQS